MPSRTAANKRAGFPALWLSRGLAACVLWPLSKLFSLLAAWRRQRISPQRLDVPVIVVGGITVGGAGKTPLTLWLIDALRKRGYVPGVISRGYGGAASGVLEVLPGSSAGVCGDEPLLLCERGQVPVFVGVDRVAAGRALRVAHPEVNVILCDDGLQHYRLARDVEIVVLDRRGVGNGWTLPAGPLREPTQRLKAVDALVLNEAEWSGPRPAHVFRMALEGDRFYSLRDAAFTAPAADLRGRRLHAVAGIGEPQRFFDHLRGLGLEIEAHAFPDHHAYTPDEVDFDGATILTTEKDAVKLRAVLSPDSATVVWVLPVTAALQPGLDQLIVERLNGRAPA